MSSDTTVICPKCNTQIDINKMLYEHLENKIRNKYEIEAVEQRKFYENAMSDIKNKEKIFKEKQERLEEKVRDEVYSKLKIERVALHEQLKKQILDEQSGQFALLQKELLEKSEKLKELNNSKIEIERLKREKESATEEANLRAEQMLTIRLKEEKERIQKSIDEQNELRFKEKDKQLEDQKKLIEEMRRKAEQGSTQMQGEVQELAIEEWLSIQYPFDTIEEVKKGQRGGDCIQRIHTREMQNCGTIYYESKRTKDFQATWIEKFKADMREKGVDVGVLVTNTMPANLERMGLLDGVWVCSFEEFKGLSAVLRENIIRLAYIIKSGENKGDKMHLLYDYLTSNEFHMQIEAIVEAFVQMQTDLDGEKRAMARIWKQREKQLSKVLDSTTGMYGSIRGIAGNAIANIKILELPHSSEEDL